MKYVIEKKIIRECLTQLEGYNEDIDINLRDFDQAESFVHVIISMYKPVEVIVNEIAAGFDINKRTVKEKIVALFNLQIITHDIRGDLLELNNTRNLTMHYVLHSYPDSRIFQRTVTLFNILHWYYQEYHNVELPQEIITKNKLALGPPPSGTTKPNKQKIRRFEEILQSELQDIAENENWHSDALVDYLIDQVEVVKDNITQPKITTLKKNIYKSLKWYSRARSFLLLGEPGSGKSIAIRRLCQDILARKKSIFPFKRSTKCIPVYIPLREWVHTSEQSLEEFIFSYLAQHGNGDIASFTKKHFLYLLEKKKFFFFLDGFDEIPTVLSTVQNAQLLETISQNIQRFIVSKKNYCLISSRKFKCPIPKLYRPEITYYLKPVSEEIVLHSYAWRKKFSVLKSIYNSPSLRGLMKTPLTITYIHEYLEKKGDALPPNKAALYASIIEGRLVPDRIKEAFDMTKEEVLDCAKRIAAFTHGTKEDEEYFGLNKPILQLEQQFPNTKISSAIDALEDARLVHRTPKRVAFIHRSIHDYFFAKHLRDYELDLEQQYSINNRNAYILYIELTQANKHLEEIFNLCIGKVQYLLDEQSSYGSKKYKEGLFYLRYLIDAFKTKEKVLRKNQDRIREFIFHLLDKSNNLILKKHALEATELLLSPQRENVVEDIIRNKKYDLGYNSYISDALIESTKLMKTVGDKTQENIRMYCGKKALVRHDNSSIEFATTNKPYLFPRINRLYYALLGMKLYPTQEIYTNGSSWKLTSYLVSTVIVRIGLWALGILVFLVGASQQEEITPLNIFNAIITLGILLVTVYILVEWFSFLVHFCQLSDGKSSYSSSRKRKMPTPRNSFTIAAGGIAFACFGIIRLFCGVIELGPMEFKGKEYDIYVNPYGHYYIGVAAILVGMLILYFFNKRAAEKKAANIFFNDFRLFLYQRGFIRKKQKEMTRETLSAKFYQYKTEYFREKFMNRFKKRKIQIKPNSKWTDGKLPNVDDDEASGIIAEIEENLNAISRY